MSEVMTPERLLAEDKASINRLTSQVAALREALAGMRIEDVAPFWSRLRGGKAARIALADTEAAAREHDRRLKLEGAREFVRRCQPKGNPSLNTTVESVLAEMEADHASR